MDGQSGECLSGALRKANVRKALLFCGLEDVLDAVWDVVEGKFVNGKVPEFDRRGRAVDGFLGVFVAAVVSKLNRLAKFIINMENIQLLLTQTSNPLSTSSNGRHLCSSVKQTQTSEFMSRPWCM